MRGHASSSQCSQKFVACLESWPQLWHEKTSINWCVASVPGRWWFVVPFAPDLRFVTHSRGRRPGNRGWNGQAEMYLSPHRSRHFPGSRHPELAAGSIRCTDSRPLPTCPVQIVFDHYLLERWSPADFVALRVGASRNFAVQASSPFFSIRRPLPQKSLRSGALPIHKAE